MSDAAMEHWQRQLPRKVLVAIDGDEWWNFKGYCYSVGEKYRIVYDCEEEGIVLVSVKLQVIVSFQIEYYT